MYGTTQSAADTRDPVHSNLVAAIAAFLRPSLYVELGASYAETFSKVVPYCDRAVAVDMKDYRDHYDSLGLAEMFACADTVAYLGHLDHDTVDMAFLDSSHAYEKTMEEWAALEPRVRPNGVVCFHDSYPPNIEHQEEGQCGKVFKAIEYIKSRYSQTWEFCTLPAQFGVTIARKNLGKQVLY